MFSVLAHDALRVSLEDLHSAESKGKWWLVGAAWSGNPLVDAQESITNVQVNGQTTAAGDAGDNLSKLARKQGMNTGIRRSIFVVLMSSDVRFISHAPGSRVSLSVFQDYVDACERLSQLNLTEVQQREIIRVLLHCCGNVRLPFLSSGFALTFWVGENIQPLLRPRMPAALQTITLLQNHVAILSLGLPTGYG